MRGGAPAAHELLVAKSKTLLILSPKSGGAKRENRLRHQYPKWTRAIKLADC